MRRKTFVPGKKIIGLYSAYDLTLYWIDMINLINFYIEIYLSYYVVLLHHIMNILLTYNTKTIEW